MYRNYLRLQVLFLHVCTKVLRHVVEHFAKEEWGGVLEDFNLANFIKTKVDILKDLQRRKILNKSQVEAIENGQYQEWDITLLAVVLLNMVQMEPHERAAVESIRTERNNIQHSSNVEVNDANYYTIWTNVTNSIRLLASVSGPDFKADIEKYLKTTEQLDEPGEPWKTVIMELLKESKMNLILQKLNELDKNVQSIHKKISSEPGSLTPKNQCDINIENNSRIFMENLMKKPSFKTKRSVLEQAKSFLTNEKVVVLTSYKEDLVMSILKDIVMCFQKEMRNVTLLNTTSEWKSVSPNDTGLIILKNITGPWSKRELTETHTIDKWTYLFDAIHARAEGSSMSVAIVLKKTHLDEITSKLCDHKILKNVVEIRVRDAAPGPLPDQSQTPSAGTSDDVILRKKDQHLNKLGVNVDDTNKPRNSYKLVTDNSTSHSFISCILVSSAQDCIVVVDVWTSCIKLFHTEQQKPHAEVDCKLKNWNDPWAVAEVPNTQQFAVTFPKDNKIRMFELTKTFTFTVCRNFQTIQTVADCRGICSLEGYLVVSFGTAGDCREHGMIQIVALTGDVYKQIDHKGGEPLFNNPKYLVLSPEKNLIHVSDKSKNKIITIDFEGTVWSEIDIQRPGCVIADPSTGGLYICSKATTNLFQACCETDTCFDVDAQHFGKEPVAMAFDRAKQCLHLAFRGSPEIMEYAINTNSQSRKVEL
ncbi:uncharacterized protein LOC128209050 [Mya arenaria]|uniref:uncharacterized protein LOC128209050 n=1 Tax=Mya arenaria TaxID=6604 RepID=UPI0022E0ED46|nr:uncharacterized protein LOC128209050 [Mya arenaria]